MKITAFPFLLILLVFLLGCKDEELVNPYEVEEVEQGVLPPDLSALPSDNFAWIHQKIFLPTCANSGCHDGSFEPHFTSIASSYATLVNHPVISNDAAFSFEYRVAPGSSAASLLFERLTNEIPNSSGMMPLVVDADSDWNERRDEYLQAIQNWINNGAPDIYGNPAPSANGNFPPQVDGILVFPEGSNQTPFERDPESVGVSPIQVPAISVDIWLAVSDDQTPAQSLGINELRISENPGSIDDAPAFLFSTAAQLNGPGFTGGSVTYTHKATVDLSTFPSGSTLFLRSYFDDGDQLQMTAIPNEGSSPVITGLFTLQLP